MLFANSNFKDLLVEGFFIRELRFNVSVNMSGSGAVGLGVGVGSYQPGVYVPLKALFLVSLYVEHSGLAVEGQTVNLGAGL